MRLRPAAAAIACVLAVPCCLRAQGVAEPGAHHELRADVIADRTRTDIQVGAGLQVPAGPYARIGVVGAVGTDVRSATHQVNGRVDVLGRFLLDPFRQTPWGLSAGAGVSVRSEAGGRPKPFLLAVVDVEGRNTRGVSPALQLGVGGGFRVGMALRWGRAGAR